jgi:short-subunit dehydrogenase
MNAPVCVISGVGPGTGSALAKRFAEGGYRVALLARSESRLAALEQELANAKGYPCDVSDPEQLERAAADIERDLGQPSVLIHNAVGGAFGTFREIDPAILNRNFQVNTMGLLYLARRFVPAMVDAGHGAIVATGKRRHCGASLPLPALRRPRPRSASWLRRWRASSARKGCTSPTSSSMR